MFGCRLLITLSVVASLVIIAGCNSTPGLQKVAGKVEFADGTFPAAEVAIIRFEPIAGTHAPEQSKAASGDIGPDGKYELTTVETGDGAYVGEYNVTFTVLKTYVGRESLLDPQFTSASTTPHKAKVTKEGPNEFNFKISKAPGR